MYSMPRRATREDIPAMRELIKRTYNDSDAYCDWFFGHCFDSAACYVTMAGAEVAATGMVIPAKFAWAGGIYPVGMNYAAAVAPAHRRKGLIKALTALANRELMESGAKHAMAYINLCAHKPWQSIGYMPAFPMRMYREPCAPAPDIYAREALPGDAPALARIYAEAFRGYARLHRDERDWRMILAEYALDGGTLALCEGGEVTGYCVYTSAGETLVIRETVAPDAVRARGLRSEVMRACGRPEAEVHAPPTPENLSECVPIGVIKRLAPGGMPDFPYDKGYFNLLHM